MQDATKVLLGTLLESGGEISHHDGDAGTFKAGLAVSRMSTGFLSLLKSTGPRIGISMGANLALTSLNAGVCRAGTKVPMVVANKRNSAVVTITSFANLVSTTPDTLTVGATVFAAQSGAATAGQATFQAATSNNATAASLAAQINAHATASALVKAAAVGAVVTIVDLKDGATGNAVALVYTNNDANVGLTLAGVTAGKLSGGTDAINTTDITWVVKGTPVYIDDISGKATDGTLPGSTISNATYRDVLKTGIQEDGSSVPCAIIDMVGGL